MDNRREIDAISGRPNFDPFSFSQPLRGGDLDWAAAISKQFKVAVVDRVGELLLREAKRQAKPVSQTISGALYLQSSIGKQLGGSAGMYVQVRCDYYWAKFVHDGHKQIRPRNKKWLAWYPNDPVSNDPRLQGKHPVRRSDVLSLDGFIAKADQDKRQGKLVFTKTRKKQPARPFLKWALDACKPQIIQIVKEETAKAITRITFEDWFPDEIDFSL